MVPVEPLATTTAALRSSQIDTEASTTGGRRPKLAATTAGRFGGPLRCQLALAPRAAPWPVVAGTMAIQPPPNPPTNCADGPAMAVLALMVSTATATPFPPFLLPPPPVP